MSDNFELTLPSVSGYLADITSDYGSNTNSLSSLSSSENCQPSPSPDQYHGIVVNFKGGLKMLWSFKFLITWYSGDTCISFVGSQLTIWRNESISDPSIHNLKDSLTSICVLDTDLLLLGIYSIISTSTVNKQQFQFNFSRWIWNDNLAPAWLFWTWDSHFTSFYISSQSGCCMEQFYKAWW